MSSPHQTSVVTNCFHVFRSTLLFFNFKMPYLKVTRNFLYALTYFTQISLYRVADFTIQGVSKNGNPNLAYHCALITGCINAIFDSNKDQGLSS